MNTWPLWARAWTHDLCEPGPEQMSECSWGGTESLSSWRQQEPGPGVSDVREEPSRSPSWRQQEPGPRVSDVREERAGAARLATSGGGAAFVISVCLHTNEDLFVPVHNPDLFSLSTAAPGLTRHMSSLTLFSEKTNTHVHSAFVSTAAMGRFPSGVTGPWHWKQAWLVKYLHKVVKVSRFQIKEKPLKRVNIPKYCSYVVLVTKLEVFSSLQVSFT